MTRWTAIVLAGQRPGENAFAEAHGVMFKALIPVLGTPMIERVLRTLLSSRLIGKIVILGQDPEALLPPLAAEVRGDPRVTIRKSGDGISTSIAAIAGGPVAPFPLLVTTADHPLLTPGVVETFLGQAGDADAAFAVVDRQTVEAVLPQTRRTWLRFGDGDFSGANLFALRTPAAHKGLALWSEVEKDRKKAVKLMLSFGPVLALRALTRTISIDRALEKVGRRVGFAVRAVKLPFAEAAVDVDREADLVLAEQILAGRDRTAEAGRSG
jgi:CTP:molybdopterin cytidylyltransferase MocA